MKILSGTVATIKRKLQTAIPDDVKIDDQSGFDIEVEPEDNCDGSKPVLTLHIVKITKRRSVLR
jgi:hypothetical protein